MDSLPIELIRDIASTDIHTYHALITAYPRFARDVPPIPRIGYKDRFDYMIDFGVDVRICGYYCGRFIEWTCYGLTHMNNAPAVVHEDGSNYWYKHGQVHRDDDKPAVIECDGSLEWFINGEYHRDGDQPAIIYATGGREWWQHGKLHRDGSPAIIRANGKVKWYCNGFKL